MAKVLHLYGEAYYNMMSIRNAVHIFNSFMHIVR